MNFKVQNFEKEHIPTVKDFTDRWIGEGYFSFKDLEKTWELSQTQGLNASYLAFAEDELAAVRLSFAPGEWTQTMHGLSTEKWDVQVHEMGYFKSLFVAEKFQRQGLGRKLSRQSLTTLEQMGAKAVACHCWAESPGNSSQKYLESMGFKKVAEHPKFWHDIDYLCTRCTPDRCQCTALEMVRKEPL